MSYTHTLTDYKAQFLIHLFCFLIVEFEQVFDVSSDSFSEKSFQRLS